MTSQEIGSVFLEIQQRGDVGGGELRDAIEGIGLAIESRRLEAIKRAVVFAQRPRHIAQVNDAATRPRDTEKWPLGSVGLDGNQWRPRNQRSLVPVKRGGE